MRGPYQLKTPNQVHLLGGSECDMLNRKQEVSKIGGKYIL